MKRLAFQGTIIRIAGLAVGLGTSVLLARALQPAQLGQYAFLLTVAELLTIISLFGSPALILREVAAGLSTGEYARVKGIISWTGRNTLLLSIPLMGLAWLGSYIWLQVQQISLAYPAVLLTVMLIPLNAFIRQRANIIQGAGHVVAAQGYSILLSTVFFLFGLLCMFVLRPSAFKLTNVFVLMVVSQAAALLTLQIKMKTVLPSQLASSTPASFPDEWLRASLPLLLVGSLLIINTRIDIVMLGYMQDSADLGLYRIAQRGGQLMLLGVMAVDSILNPMAAKAWARQETVPLQAAVSKSIWLVLGLTLPLFCIYLSFGHDLIRWIYGGVYVKAWQPLVLLSAGYLSLALLGRGGTILTMSHFEKDTAKAIGIGASANIFLNLFFIPRYGINGAALATAMAVTLRMTLEAIFAYRKAGINTTIFVYLTRRKSC